MGGPEISIVIPTRNRPLLAQIAIESVLTGMKKDVEVIVADNSDTPIDVPSDPRVTVLPRLDRVITMTENWERALRATRGEWISFISDKHRVVPRLYERVLELAKAAGLRVAGFERACLYQDIPHHALTADALWHDPGRLLAPGSPATWATRPTLETMAEWFRVIRGAPHRPQIYRGIVHRSVIEAAMRKTGSFFFGTCPDYASGLQSMAEVDHYLSTNLPAVVVQIPTSDIGAWSPAQSLDRGGKLGTERMREVGRASFARHQLPVTVTSSILETLLEFQRLRPDACRTLEVDWKRYAWLAANELENSTYMSASERWRSHALVARVTQRDGINARALSTLARVIVSRRSPELAAGYLRLQRMLRAAPARGIARPWPLVDHPRSSLAQARESLEHVFGSPERAAS